MRTMTDAEKAALLKTQAGLRAAKDGLTDLMALARLANDHRVLLAAQGVHGALNELHAKAGQAADALYTDASVVIMGPGR